MKKLLGVNKLTKQGKISIPTKVIEKLGLKRNEEAYIKFVYEDGKIFIEPVKE